MLFVTRYHTQGGQMIDPKVGLETIITELEELKSKTGNVQDYVAVTQLQVECYRNLHFVIIDNENKEAYTRVPKEVIKANNDKMNRQLKSILGE